MLRLSRKRTGSDGPYGGIYNPVQAVYMTRRRRKAKADEHLSNPPQSDAPLTLTYELLSSFRQKLERTQRMIFLRRKIFYPIAMLVVLVLMAISLFMVIVNTGQLLIGWKVFKNETSQLNLGASSLSVFGPIGAGVETIVILYLFLTSIVGFYSLPFSCRLVLGLIDLIIDSWKQHIIWLDILITFQQAHSKMQRHSNNEAHNQLRHHSHTEFGPARSLPNSRHYELRSAGKLRAVKMAGIHLRHHNLQHHVRRRRGSVSRKQLQEICSQCHYTWDKEAFWFLTAHSDSTYHFSQELMRHYYRIEFIPWLAFPWQPLVSGNIKVIRLFSFHQMRWKDFRKVIEDLLNCCALRKWLHCIVDLLLCLGVSCTSHFIQPC